MRHALRDCSALRRTTISAWYDADNKTSDSRVLFKAAGNSLIPIPNSRDASVKVSQIGMNPYQSCINNCQAVFESCNPLLGIGSCDCKLGVGNNALGSCPETVRTENNTSKANKNNSHQCDESSWLHTVSPASRICRLR